MVYRSPARWFSHRLDRFLTRPSTFNWEVPARLDALSEASHLGPVCYSIGHINIYAARRIFTTTNITQNQYRSIPAHAGIMISDQTENETIPEPKVQGIANSVCTDHAGRSRVLLLERYCRGYVYHFATLRLRQFRCYSKVPAIPRALRGR